MKANDNSSYIVTRLFWKIFPVQFFLAAIAPINALIDNLIASNAIGSDAVAGVALFSPLSGFLNGVSGLFAVGGVVIIIRHLGKTEKERANSTYSTIIIVSVVISLLFTMVMLLFAPFIASMLGGSGNQYLIDYTKGIAVFQIAAYLSAFLMNSLQVVGDNKRAVVSIVAMAASNVGGDILFVVVLGMGAYGLGLATAISYIVQLVVLVPPFIKKDCPLKFSMGVIDFSSLSECIKQGLPSALVNITFVVKALSINFALIASGGDMAVAAGAVQNVVAWFLRAILMGAGQTAIMLLALYVSEEDRESFKNTFIVSLKKTTIVSILMIIFIVCFSGQISRAFFQVGTAEYAYSVDCLLIIPYFVLPGVLLRIIMSAYQTLGHTNVSVGLTISENVVAAITLLILAKILGVRGVWLGLLVGELIALLIGLMYSWIAAKKISFKVEVLSPMAGKLDIDEEHRLSRTIYNMDGAIGLSKDICDFCNKLGLGTKKAMISGLAIEEICILMFKYSLYNVKNAQADVRIFYKDDVLTIRFRDNGRIMFNGDKIEVNDPNDPAANIGIKMLINMATDITANSIMGLNVITVKM